MQIPSVLILLLISSSSVAVFGFNLDVRNPVTVTGTSGSYFGYSLAVHQDANSNL